MDAMKHHPEKNYGDPFYDKIVICKYVNCIRDKVFKFSLYAIYENNLCMSQPYLTDFRNTYYGG